MPSLYWMRCPSPWGSLRLLATDQGLCRVVLPGEEGVEHWVGRYLAGSVLVEGALVLREAAEQLQRYFSGKGHSFDLPLDIHGTPFQQAVWKALLEIPYGETRSYAQVAAAVGRPRAARAVGMANGANPLPIVIPCHRVICSDGSLGGYGGGLALKEALLRLEGCTGGLFVLE
jgi:O-6-methylguanine DNA methyltransferase